MEYDLDEIQIKNIVVGSGAAGYNAAIRLVQFGEQDTALITEGIKSGTSRNTGSDKQTYYKLSLAGGASDSVLQMAQDLFSGGCVDGDIALVEAALSARSFYHLVESGVEFPDNRYGEYMGYRTDHSKSLRATSAGPYTSKRMTECLEEEAARMRVQVYDHLQMIRILTEAGRVRGVLCLDLGRKERPRFVVIRSENVVLATGGPAGMYRDSVYPASQTGSSGLAFLAGVKGKNLTEWQFGIASLRPRWNVSGTYMQVLPRFISTDQGGGDEREFLDECFTDRNKELLYIFRKGYQWPFDTDRAMDGSSLIDILVYEESVLKGRRVYLDFTRNPGGGSIDFEHLPKEAASYLEKAGACFGTPIERLMHMNAPAADFYRTHKVDLAKDPLEIAVCAQHNNGGLAADADYETDIKGLYAVGEVCGSHGVKRPGGSALNAGQAGSLRAAEAIAFGSCVRTDQDDSSPVIKGSGCERDTQAGPGATAQTPDGSGCQARVPLTGVPRAVDMSEDNCESQIVESIRMVLGTSGKKKVSELTREAGIRMSRFGGMIRSGEGLREALKETRHVLTHLREQVFIPDVHAAGRFYHLFDTLIAQMVYLSAMIDYREAGGQSRGSALYTDTKGSRASKDLPELFSFCPDVGAHSGVIQETALIGNACHSTWRAVRPIPQPDYFFENEWKDYRRRMGLEK